MKDRGDQCGSAGGQACLHLPSFWSEGRTKPSFALWEDLSHHETHSKAHRYGARLSECTGKVVAETKDLGIKVFIAGSPSHQLAEVEEIEGVALFFASDSSSFVTGAHFNLDGGRLLGLAD